MSHLQDKIIMKNQNISVKRNVIKRFFASQTPFKIIFLIINIQKLRDSPCGLFYCSIGIQY